MKRASTQAGFTLIEMFAVVVILLIIGGLGFKAIQMTATASAATVFRADLDTRVHRTLARVARELQEAKLEELVPEPSEPFGASTVAYRCAEVPDIEEIVWGEFRQLVLAPSPEDPADGRDNDHDGIVDEHELRLIHDVGLSSERMTVLVRNVAPRLEGEQANATDDNGNGLVDEPGFCLARRDGILHIRLTLLGKDPRGEVVARTAETTVWPRN
ncbi:MAG: type II secretion system protein [Planctomycetota bacterium]|nr:type II secretion system protein [Planctomycetota bacterium]